MHLDLTRLLSNGLYHSLHVRLPWLSRVKKGDEHTEAGTHTCIPGLALQRIQEQHQQQQQHEYSHIMFGGAEDLFTRYMLNRLRPALTRRCGL